MLYPGESATSVAMKIPGRQRVDFSLNSFNGFWGREVSK